MNTVLVFLTTFTATQAYLDVTVFRMDNRTVNENGTVNPCLLAMGTIASLYNVPKTASNQVAWTAWANYLNKMYGTKTALNIQNNIQGLANTVVDTFNSVPAALQSLAVGYLNDTFNSITRQPNYYKSSKATIQGQTSLQMAYMNLQQVIYPALNNLFYNPFDTQMIGYLNDSNVQKYTINLFDYLSGKYGPMYYSTSYLYVG